MEIIICSINNINYIIIYFIIKYYSFMEKIDYLVNFVYFIKYYSFMEKIDYLVNFVCFIIKFINFIIKYHYNLLMD